MGKFCYCFNFAVKESVWLSLCHRLCGTVPSYLLQLEVLSFCFPIVSPQGTRDTTNMVLLLCCLTVLGWVVIVLKRMRKLSLFNEHSFSNEKVINI